MESRNTKQKSIILETLKGDKSHPTIQELYRKVNKIDPSIGQATVYRNINKLVTTGEILKLSTGNDVYHYDGNCSRHYHLLCKKCHKIIDIFDDSYDDTINKIESKYSIKIDNAMIFFDGVCGDCSGKV